MSAFGTKRAFHGLVLMPVLGVKRTLAGGLEVSAALGADIKGKISPVLYAVAILLAFVSPWISIVIYVMVAVMWLVPDRRIESVLREKSK